MLLRSKHPSPPEANQSLLLDDSTLARFSTVETDVFVQQLIGDFYRYIAEAFPNEESNEHKESLNNAENAYKLAQQITAKRELHPCNPIRLGLSLNLAVFYYNVLDDKKSAKKLANEAILMAESTIDKVDEATYKEAKTLLALLKEDLEEWSKIPDEDEEDQQI